MWVIMVLFGKEFNFDERAQVNRRLRAVEGDAAILLSHLDWLAVKVREDFVKERRRTDRSINLPEENPDFVDVCHIRCRSKSWCRGC